MPGNTTQTVVITGAANGLGRALAKELYKAGYELALLDIDEKGLTVLREELSGQQPVSIHTCDISKETEVAAATQAICKQHTHISILINNAGISISRWFEQLDLRDYQHLFAVNFWGTVYCTKHFLPALKQQTDSRIVNIISDFALLGFPGKTAYASSKSAVMGFTHSLQTEMEGTSVRVCLVIPPPLDTGLVTNSLHIDAEKRQQEALFLKRKGMPLEKAAKRIVTKVRQGRSRIVIGSMMYWIDLLSRWFPTQLHKAVGRRKDKIGFM